MQNTDTERILLTNLSHGDAKAFESLFMLYFPKLKLFLSGFLDSEAEAEDLAQDVFVKLWQNRLSLAEVENLNAYLYRIAKNTLYTYLDRSYSPNTIPMEESFHIASVEELEEIVFAKELEELIEVTIEKMPPKRKAIFCMSRKQGLSNDEIAFQLNISKRTVETHISAALTDLETANQALRGEVARERELDRQRMAFFSAASHELKTPVTILKGQLAGMLEGVGVYQDRDKYLLRSLQTTGRMERLIGEMLSISRMESGSAAVRQEPVDLSALMAQQLALDRELLEQRGQQLVSALTPGITVPADASLLGKAVGNLLSNASRYSPEGAEIRVWCGRLEGRPALSVENTGARVSGDALPHLFEAFYREEGSRNRSTGGSGLGLYLVKMILDRHGAVCTIENTEEGVKATVRF